MSSIQVTEKYIYKSLKFAFRMLDNEHQIPIIVICQETLPCKCLKDMPIPMCMNLTCHSSYPWCKAGPGIEP